MAVFAVRASHGPFPFSGSDPTMPIQSCRRPRPRRPERSGGPADLPLAATPAWLGRAGPFLALLAVTLFGACGGDAAENGPPPVPVVTFDTGAVVIEAASDTFRLPVELALTDDQRAYGLMERSYLPEEQGMLFVYPASQDSSAGFWMYRTRIPLDIAFLDGSGRILDIQTMEPCPSPNPRVCLRYGPGVPFVAALEANAGFFRSRGIEAGDRILRVDQGAGAAAHQ